MTKRDLKRRSSPRSKDELLLVRLFLTRQVCERSFKQELATSTSELSRARLLVTRTESTPFEYSMNGRQMLWADEETQPEFPFDLSRLMQDDLVFGKEAARLYFDEKFILLGTQHHVKTFREDWVRVKGKKDVGRMVELKEKLAGVDDLRSEDDLNGTTSTPDAKRSRAYNSPGATSIRTSDPMQTPTRTRLIQTNVHSQMNDSGLIILAQETTALLWKITRAVPAIFNDQQEHEDANAVQQAFDALCMVMQQNMKTNELDQLTQSESNNLHTPMGRSVANSFNDEHVEHTTTPTMSSRTDVGLTPQDQVGFVTFSDACRKSFTAFSIILKDLVVEGKLSQNQVGNVYDRLLQVGTTLGLSKNLMRASLGPKTSYSIKRLPEYEWVRDGAMISANENGTTLGTCLDLARVTIMHFAVQFPLIYFSWYADGHEALVDGCIIKCIKEEKRLRLYTNLFMDAAVDHQSPAFGKLARTEVDTSFPASILQDQAAAVQPAVLYIGGDGNADCREIVIDSLKHEANALGTEFDLDLVDTWDRGRTTESIKVPHFTRAQLDRHSEWLSQTPFADAGAIDDEDPVIIPVTSNKNRDGNDVSFSFPPDIRNRIID